MANDLITVSSVNSNAMWQAGGTALKTLSVAPSTTGALLVLATTAGSNTASTAVSGGGCSASGSGLPGAWQLVAGPFSSNVPWKLELWMGVVNTTGASTITITNTSSGTNRLNCKEFLAGGPGTTWSQDGAGGTKQNATSATVTYPTLTPSGENRLYAGFGVNGTGLTTGATPSGTIVELDPGTNPYLYNPDVANSAQSPTSNQSASAVSYTIGALIKADNPVRQPLPYRARLVRASHW